MMLRSTLGRAASFLVAILTFATVAGQPARAVDTLLAGAATAVITPAIGTVMNGGSAPAISTHVHDELHARALVLVQGNERLAWIQLDTCLIDRALVDELKTSIHTATGLDPARIGIAATHTHSAGSLIGAHLTEADPAYRRWIVGPVTDSVRRALRNLAPATAGWTNGSLPQHVFNRRIRVQPGSTYTNLLGRTGDAVKMNWSSPSPDDHSFAGPVDPQVFVLSVRHRDGRPLALLANYSLHYVGGTGPGEISADYFGAFCDELTDHFNTHRQDPPFVPILSNGTSGDINNIDYRTPRRRQPPYAQIRRVARDLAQEVARITRGLPHVDRVQLGHAATEVTLSVRKPDASTVAAAKALLAGRGPDQLRSWVEIQARDQLILADWPDTLRIPLQVFRIGDVRIAQWPGEIFAETGLELKQARPPGTLFNISLANGWFGYIPPPRQHALGAYETWPLRTSPLETNAIPRLTEAFHQLLHRLD